MRNNYAERIVPKSTAAADGRPAGALAAGLAAATAANDPRAAPPRKPGLY